MNPNKLSQAFLDLARACEAVAEALREEAPVGIRGREVLPSQEPMARPEREPRKQKPLDIAGADSAPAGSNKTRRKILLALAQMGKSLSAAQIGFLTGLAHKGGAFSKALTDLRADGAIEGGNSGMVILDTGSVELGDYAPLPTGHALFQHWCSKLGATHEKILRALKICTSAQTKEDLGTLTGLSHTGGSFSAALTDLRRMELITGGGGGMQLSPDFRRAIEPTIAVFDKSANRTVKVDRTTGHAR